MHIYLDNAATTWPKPVPVQEAVVEYFQNCYGSVNRTNMKSNGISLESVRKELINYFNANEEYLVAFVPSATIAMNIAIRYLKENNCSVVTSNIEHNCVYRPINEMEVKNRIIDIMNDDLTINESALINNLNKKEAIIINHGSNVIGSVVNLHKIGVNKSDNILIVDGSQTAGICDIDLQEDKIDIFIGGAHKHLFGLPGIGFIIFKKEFLLPSIYYGGTGRKSLDFFQPKIWPDCLEAGTMNLPGILALTAGLRYCNEERRKQTRNIESKLVAYFLDEAKRINGMKVYVTADQSKATGVVSFTLRGLNPSYIIAPQLERHNIYVRAGLHCAPYIHKKMKTQENGTVRISFSPFNAVEDIDYLVMVLKRLIA